MNLPHITVFSTPLVSTWVFDETHRILFDAGDGVSALLEGLVQRAKVVAITHTHRDHCAGLMQLLNLRAGEGDFTAIYPAASGSARSLAEFLTRFDTRSTSKTNWRPMEPGDVEAVEPNRHYLRAFETFHYPHLEGVVGRSLGYQLCREVDRLKPEMRDLPQADLDALRKAHGRDHITQTEEDILLSVSGDTLPLDPSVYAGSQVLLHECTFLDHEDREDTATYGHPHSCLDEVLEIARDARVGHLALYHISRRYETEKLFARVRSRAKRIGLVCPISVATPGRLHDNLLSRAIWKGAAVESERATNEEPDGREDG
jgi:ribonuclease Z